MVRPARAQVLAAEKSSRPLGWSLAIGGLLWEGINKLGEHIVLTWIAERLEEQKSVVTVLEWTVDHPIWFLLMLAVVYLAVVCLRAMFSHATEDNGRRDGDKGNDISQQAQAGQAGAIGSMGDVGRSNVNVGGNQNVGTHQTVIYQSSSPANPMLCISKWGSIPEEYITASAVGQTGFELVNDGEVAHAISVEDFEIAPGKLVKSAELQRIEGHGHGYVLAWLDGHGPGEIAKWDLHRAMSEAGANRDQNPYAPDYMTTVSVIYRDSSGQWFRSFASLTFVRTQSRLALGPTRHSQRVRCEFLEGFYSWGDFSHTPSEGPTTCDFYITLLLRLTNDGVADLSIKDARLTVRHPEASVTLRREPAVLPQPHRVRYGTTYHMGAEGTTRSAVRSVDDIPAIVVLRPGCPIDGLMQFIFRGCIQRYDDEFQNKGYFILELVDAQDNIHRITRPISPWQKTGKIEPYAMPA
jgi:hypothetical protein